MFKLLLSKRACSSMILTLSSPYLLQLSRSCRTTTKIIPKLTTRGIFTPQRSLPAAYWRGGTSRGVVFQRKDLPTDETQWPSIFLRVLGSPDEHWRQLDGLGAGVSTLSKICIVSPSTHTSADIDYTFGAVSRSSSEVDFSANCGNMASAIGPYSYNHGLVPRATERNTTVRIHNTNTNKIMHSTFPITDDGREAATSGDCAIPGVPGTGAEITLSFLDPSRSKTGKLRPTGNVVDKLDGTEVSCIDVANPCVFVRALDVGVNGTELPKDMLENAPLLYRLEHLRRLGAEAMGLCDTLGRSQRALPKIAVVSRPAKHKVLSGEYLEAHEVDLVARVMSDRQPHRAIPLTVALCVAAAATVKGSVVEAMLGPKRANEGVLTIGHPSGAIQVATEIGSDGLVRVARVVRTSRPIMEGMVYF